MCPKDRGIVLFLVELVEDGSRLVRVHVGLEFAEELDGPIYQMWVHS
jgi:hypothetical protein